MTRHSDGYFNSPIVSPLVIASLAGYACETYFINRCTNSVFIKDRSGIITEVPPCTHQTAPGYPSGSLVIHQIHRLTQKAMNSWEAQYAQTDTSFRTSDMHAKAEIPRTVKGTKGHWQDEGILSYNVELSGAPVNRRIKYVKEFDLVVMAGVSLEEAMREHHPFSKIGEVCLNAYSGELQEGLSLKILYVSNAGLKDSLWTHINDKIVEIKPTVDARYSDGIFVLYPSGHGNNGYNPMAADGFADLEAANAAQIGMSFFASYAQAQLYLTERENCVHQLRLDELRAKQMTAEASLHKANKEYENIERKALEDQKRYEMAIAEMAAELQKQKQESLLRAVEHSKKNTLDVIKYVPVMLTTMLSIGALFRKK